MMSRIRLALWLLWNAKPIIICLSNGLRRIEELKSDIDGRLLVIDNELVTQGSALMAMQSQVYKGRQPLTTRDADFVAMLHPAEVDDPDLMPSEPHID